MRWGPQSVENSGGTLEEMVNHCFKCGCVLEPVLGLFGGHEGFVLEPKIVLRRLPGGSREGSGRLPGGIREPRSFQEASRAVLGAYWGPLGLSWGPHGAVLELS